MSNTNLPEAGDAVVCQQVAEFHGRGTRLRCGLRGIWWFGWGWRVYRFPCELIGIPTRIRISASQSEWLTFKISLLLSFIKNVPSLKLLVEFDPLKCDLVTRRPLISKSRSSIREYSVRTSSSSPSSSSWLFSSWDRWIISEGILEDVLVVEEFFLLKWLEEDFVGRQPQHNFEITAPILGVEGFFAWMLQCFLQIFLTCFNLIL